MCKSICRKINIFYNVIIKSRILKVLIDCKNVNIDFIAIIEEVNNTSEKIFKEENYINN